MLPTSAGVEPATSWSPVGRRIQLSHRGLHYLRTYAGNNSCSANCWLCIYSVIYWLPIFKIKMILHRAKSLTIWPGMTPTSTVFPKICASNSVSWLYAKIAFALLLNHIILSRTMQEMILIHICCSFVKMRQESAMPNFRHFLKLLKINPLLPYYGPYRKLLHWKSHKIRFILWRGLGV